MHRVLRQKIDDWGWAFGGVIGDKSWGFWIEDLCEDLGLNNRNQGLEVKHREWKAFENHKTIRY